MEIPNTYAIPTLKGASDFHLGRASASVRRDSQSIPCTPMSFESLWTRAKSIVATNTSGKVVVNRIYTATHSTRAIRCVIMDPRIIRMALTVILR